MDEDFEVARTRKWEECGSDEKLLWLAFLPSFYHAEDNVNFTGLKGVISGISPLFLKQEMRRRNHK